MGEGGSEPERGQKDRVNSQNGSLWSVGTRGFCRHLGDLWGMVHSSPPNDHT